MTRENSMQDMGADEPQPRRSGSESSKDIIEEISNRERYNYKVDSVCSRLFQWCLQSTDQHI